MAKRYEDDFLTMAQAAERLKVSPLTVWRRVRAGQLQSFKSDRDGRVRLVRRADVDRLATPKPVGRKGNRDGK